MSNNGLNGKALPEPFPELPDYEAVRRSLAERKAPPNGLSPAEFERWRKGAIVRESDEWMTWIATVGAMKNKTAEFPQLTELAKGGALVGAQCERFDFSPAGEWANVNMDGANLRASDWSDMRVRNCQFNNADFSRAVLYHTHFVDCQFVNAEFSLGYLRGAVFENCKMMGAMIRQASAKHSLWVNSDLRSTDHALTIYLGAKWYHCRLEDARNVETAVFVWYRHEVQHDWISYLPQPGYRLVSESELGALSVQENAGRAAARRLSEALV